MGSTIFKALTVSGVPVAGVTFLGGAIFDGSTVKNYTITISDSLNGASSDKDTFSFFKDLGSSQNAHGLFIKKNLKSQSFGGVGKDLKGALGIKLKDGGGDGSTDEKKLPWILIGSTENGMFYLSGWRVTDWNGSVKKKVPKGFVPSKHKSWTDWFYKTTFTENQDEVGVDVWCDKNFETYRRFLNGYLRVIIHKDKPVFVGNIEKNKTKIFVNKNTGTSQIDFGGAKCDHSQGFAWLASSSAIVGDWVGVKPHSQQSVARKYYGLKEWTEGVKGVNLGKLTGLLLDRIDRISINSQGIKDSRGNFVKWNPKYNPTITINY